jgi:hypothetical protein
LEAALTEDDEPTPIEARIAADAQRFDLRPLLRLLAEIGYPREQVLFESSEEGRSASVVKGVRFLRRPMRSVVVTVQLGLLGDNTLLPSYFFHVIEQSPDPARFYDFLRFFDHRLIENLFTALHPEVASDDAPRSGVTSRHREGVFGDFRATSRSILRMAMPGSPSTLHWLVQLYFPEFGVRVSRQPFANSSDSHACRTGKSRLDGSSVLGSFYVAEKPGFLVDLFTEDEVDLSGREMADVVLDRLHRRVLPLLADFHLPLSVRLIVKWHASAAYVDDPGARDKSFLGYNRLRGTRKRPEVEHTTVMYQGVTGESPRLAVASSRGD